MYVSCSVQSYLAVAGALGAVPAGVAAGLLSLLFLALCLTGLILLVTSVFLTLEAAGTVWLAVAAVPGVWANTGRVSAQSSAATMREVDFMSVP